MATIRLISIQAASLLVMILLVSCAYVEHPVAGSVQPATTVTSKPSYFIIGAGGKTTGPLRVRRVELNFSNRQPQMTVPMNTRLDAQAVIKTDGNGLLQATWMVDDRVLEQVDVNLTAGSTVVINTSASTVLPTFEPGPHNVTLRIHQPNPGFSIPVIRYFVTGERATGK